MAFRTAMVCAALLILPSLACAQAGTDDAAPPTEPCRFESDAAQQEAVFQACNRLIPGGVKSAPDPEDAKRIAAGQNIAAYLKARADLFARRADYDSAIADLLRVRKIDGNDAISLDLLIFYAANGDFDAFYSEAWKMASKSELNLGKMLKKIDADFSRRTERKDRADYHSFRAMVFAELGTAEAAQAELVKSAAFVDRSDIRNEGDGITYLVRIALLERFRMDPARVLNELTDIATAPLWTRDGSGQISKHVRPGLLTALARRYLDAGDSVRALDLFATASALQPRLKAASDGREAAFAALHKPGGATTAWVPPPAGSRVALVIGNAGYRHATALVNPRNDAEQVAAALRELGFTVTLGLDLSRTQMEDQLDAFNRAASRADVGLVYYAGHALQHQGINYLLPVEARLDSESDLRRLIRMQDVVTDLRAARGFRILILDACRDNEMVRQFAQAQAQAGGDVRSVSATRGLAREKANGVFIAYATGADQVAADGFGTRNSPFTAALLRHLRTPDQDVRALFTRVRSDVVRATAGGQRPEVLDNVDGFFQFR